MTNQAVLEVLRFANSNDQAVRLTLNDRTVVAGYPVNVDLHPTAYEVYLRPYGDESETEITISLAAVISAELI